MANARDAADTLVKCNNQAMETVSHCMGDDLNDLRGMTKTGRAA
jgi:3-deoxy-D-manno-octulosonate 8-phosphate phosphatase KdsC-like HAD superfamily phosphatase